MSEPREVRYKHKQTTNQTLPLPDARTHHRPFNSTGGNI